MKPTAHPQLLAAIAISAVVIGAHSRVTASAPLIAQLPPAIPIATKISLAPLPPLRPARDPFMVHADETQPQPQPHADFDGLLKTAAGGGTQPPGAVAPDAAAVHLRAVVLGTRRYALVAEGNGTRIVTIGDALSGSRITDINIGGVVLSSGARFVPEDGAK